MPTVHHRYFVLLSLIVVLIVFELAAPDGDGARLVAVVLQAATLVAAVVTSAVHFWVVRLTVAACILLVIAAVGAVLGTEDLGGDSARVISVLLVAMAPTAIVLGLRLHFREEGGVTLQTMFGVLCIYLLIGLFFGTLFAAVQSISNESFFTTGAAHGSSDFLYFSYSTLTTVGYGDLIAATGVGRSLAIAEALIGQIYLVTVVGVIVAGLSPIRLRRDA